MASFHIRYTALSWTWQENMSHLFSCTDSLGEKKGMISSSRGDKVQMHSHFHIAIVIKKSNQQEPVLRLLENCVMFAQLHCVCIEPVIADTFERK